MRARSKETRTEKMNRGGYHQPSIYSRTQQDPERRNYKKSCLVIILICLSLGAGYLLFLSPLFKINNIKISEVKHQEKEEVQQTVKNYRKSHILSHNLITISAKGLKKKVLEIPGIKNVVVIKKYPNILLVDIEERAPAFVWQVLDHKYLVDESGLIWAMYDEKFKDSPVVYDNKNVPTELGKKPVASSFSHFIMDLDKDFQTITGSKIVKMEVIDTTNELKVQSDSTWYAYFDTTRTAKQEILNLNRILEEASKNKKKKLEYIDLRIDNKIFYK